MKESGMKRKANDLAAFLALLALSMLAVCWMARDALRALGEWMLGL